MAEIIHISVPFVQHEYSSPFIVKVLSSAQGTASFPAQEHPLNSSILEWPFEYQSDARVALAEVPLHSLLRRGKQPHPSIHGQMGPREKESSNRENLLRSDKIKAFLKWLCVQN